MQPRFFKKSEPRGWAIETVKESSSDWNDCLVRIRDIQDQSAFASLFNHFAPRVKAYLIRCGGSSSQAEEATQEAMATVWRKSHLFDPSKASASTWIYRIARNKQLDAIRRQRRPEPEELPWGNDEPEDPAAIFAMGQAQQGLRKAIEALPDKQRTIIEKAFFGELSHSEIAAVTQLPLGTIKSRIRLALERLRHELDSHIG